MLRQLLQVCADECICVCVCACACACVCDTSTRTWSMQTQLTGVHGVRHAYALLRACAHDKCGREKGAGLHHMRVHSCVRACIH